MDSVNNLSWYINIYSKICWYMWVADQAEPASIPQNFITQNMHVW